MSLRTRLWLVLGGLFLVPMLAAVVLVTVAIPQVLTDREHSELVTDRRVATAELLDACSQLGLVARSLALEAADTSPEVAVRVAENVRSVDYAALLTPQAVPVEEQGTLPPGVTPTRLASCSQGLEAGPVIAERLDVRNVPGAATAVTVTRLDGDYLDELRTRNGLTSHILLLDGTNVVASSIDRKTAASTAKDLRARGGAQEIDGWLVDVGEREESLPFRVAVLDERPRTSGESVLLLGLISVVGLALAAIPVAVIARALTQPLAELTDAAERVARGDLDARIDRSGDGEVGRLAGAFNRMTLELRRNISALEQSRGDLRDSLERIGDTLMSTHDLDGLLQVVLETAAVTLQARVGVVLYGGQDQLRLVAEHGLHDANMNAPVGVTPGVGVLGRVVSTGEAVRGRLGSGDLVVDEATGEPSDGDVLAVPIRSMGTVVGVVALYDRLDGRPFDDGDEDAMRTLANQASIAIDNVQLHQEAQRLSTTDPLTGLWNFRYLSMSLAREIERSTRFERPLAVLMLDLDLFKQVNDVYGHASGDAVLRELAQRVSEQIREVDTFARYGGEEFVVVLPETNIQGATQLAERICTAVRRQPFHVDGEALTVTLSVGVAAFPVHGSSAATLMRAADRALYVAKNEGRDRWHVPAS